ncbi:hypothetical protein PHLCEN_2v10477 [Hermanssonia centrifuga]|uniref:Uncharacterized protein n=1 Tax=Hermanssonia centrifuga TaxID=98765 RepID=A0A2R6NMF1_9APHY|nr:hypothetical protein PHLCEN_2v10477 [Hermanssonia centrifuga]
MPLQGEFGTICKVTTFGAGCAAALSAQKLYQLSPTAQLRRVKNLLDETRLLLDKLQRQNPGGIEGHSNDYKPYPALQRIYAGRNCREWDIQLLVAAHPSAAAGP